LASVVLPGFFTRPTRLPRHATGDVTDFNSFFLEFWLLFPFSKNVFSLLKNSRRSNVLMASVRFDSGISNFPNPGSSFYRFSLFLPVVISFVSHHSRFSVFADLLQNILCFMLRAFWTFRLLTAFSLMDPLHSAFNELLLHNF
jgi:hypothetical protein